MPATASVLNDELTDMLLREAGLPPDKVRAGKASSPAVGTVPGKIKFGDDASEYAKDGECDDPRFTGSGVAADNVEADRAHDATDCRTAYQAGTATLVAR